MNVTKIEMIAGDKFEDQMEIIVFTDWKDSDFKLDHTDHTSYRFKTLNDTDHFTTIIELREWLQFKII